MGEGRLVLQALRVVPGGDQEGRGHVGAHAVDGDELGGGLGDEGLQDPVDLVDLFFEGERPARERAERELGERTTSVFPVWR